LERGIKTIEEGLQLLGAEKHLELFQQQCKSQIDEFENEINSSNLLEGVNPIRDLMNSDTFERRKFSATQCSFLKSHLTWKYFRSMICLPHQILGTRLKGHR
jgi:hypothetical protein